MKHEVATGPHTFDPILRTKLYRPPLTTGLVDRERLIRVMNRALDVPLTLVSAPAGFGKSVLVVQWAAPSLPPVPILAGYLLIVHWPKGIKDKGAIREQYSYIIDIGPTIMEAIGLEPLEVIDGFK